MDIELSSLSLKKGIHCGGFAGKKMPPQGHAGRLAMLLIGTLAMALAFNSAAYPENTKKQPDLEASLSLININKPTETLVVEGATNLPKDLRLQLSLKGINYYPDSVTNNNFLSLTLAAIDKKGKYHAKITTSQALLTAEEYRIEITVDPITLKNTEKEITKAGFNIDELSKLKLIKTIYLAYPHITERRAKRALSTSDALNKFIAAYPKITEAISPTIKSDLLRSSVNQLKEIHILIADDRIFVETADAINTVMSKLAAFLGELSMIEFNSPNNSSLDEIKQKIILPTEAEVKAIRENIFITELCAKVAQDFYYWLERYGDILGGNEFWRRTNNKPLPPDISADKWKPINKQSSTHLNRITEEFDQYLKVDLFSGVTNTPKADTVLVLINDMNDLRENIGNLINAPEDTRLAAHIRDIRAGIVGRLGKIAPVTKKSAGDNK